MYLLAVVYANDGQQKELSYKCREKMIDPISHGETFLNLKLGSGSGEEGFARADVELDDDEADDCDILGKVSCCRWDALEGKVCRVFTDNKCSRWDSGYSK